MSPLLKLARTLHGCEICSLSLAMTSSLKPSILHIDNQSAISVAKNAEHFGRLKHIKLRMYWLRDVVEDGMIEPVFRPTAEMPADLLTKPLARVKVALFRSMMGLQ